MKESRNQGINESRNQGIKEGIVLEKNKNPH
jgi:hypothetical protein